MRSNLRCSSTPAHLDNETLSILPAHPHLLIDARYLQIEKELQHHEKKLGFTMNNFALLTAGFLPCFSVLVMSSSSSSSSCILPEWSVVASSFLVPAIKVSWNTSKPCTDRGEGGPLTKSLKNKIQLLLPLFFKQ